MYNVNDFQELVTRELHDISNLKITHLHNALRVALTSPVDLEEVKDILADKIKEGKMTEEDVVRAIGDYMAVLALIARKFKLPLHECCSATMYQLQHRHSPPFKNLPSRNSQSIEHTLAAAKKYTGG